MNNIKLAEETLGQRIKAQRIRMGYTQEQLAEKMQISTRTLCGIENGENFVKAETLEMFCKVFNVTSFELFAFDHLKPQEELVNEIMKDISEIKNREKIETLYKFVKALKVE